MIRKVRCVSVAASLAILLVALISPTPSAEAQVVKPFKISGAGVGPIGLPLPGQDARPHWIVGNGTHLGRHDGDGFVQTDTALPRFDADGNFTGFTGEFGSGIDADGNPLPFEFRKANGDKLVCMYGRTAFGASVPGTFELNLVGVLADGSLLVEALFIADFVPMSDLCTGDFAGASGSWVMIARTLPFALGSTDPVYYSWEGNGVLTFQQKN